MSTFFLECVENFLGIFKVSSSEDPSTVKQNIRGVNMKKFLGIFPRIGRNFSENRSELFHEYVEKFPRIFS
jgi:hypothetical protein